VQDCLVAPKKANPDGIGLIRDDNPTFMPKPPYFIQEPARNGEGATELFIFDVS